LIDHLGNINDIHILRETPSGRGFGEAALNAFRGIRATSPAELNGVPVAVRFRYPIRFALR
jgi:protein TonB